MKDNVKSKGELGGAALGLTAKYAKGCDLLITEIQPEVVAVTAQVMGAMPFIARNTIDMTHNPAYAAGYLYNQVKPRMAMATHVSYDEYVVPELVAEVRTHWNGPFAFGAPDMVVVNMTKDRIWVRDGTTRRAISPTCCRSGPRTSRSSSRRAWCRSR